MQNSSSINSTHPRPNDDLLDTVQVFWLIGLAVSCVCFLMQIVLFVLVPKCRKVDEKILAQISFTRIIVTVCEYCLFYYNNDVTFWKDLKFMIYFYMDFVLVCWMFVFTKNLYDKIIVVFSARKLSFLVTSVIICVLCLPFGIIPIFLLKYRYIKEFFLYMNIYAFIKFVIVTLNTLIYLRIFYVAKKRRSTHERTVGHILKTAFVAFLLLIATSLQVFVTDILAYFRIKTGAVKVFCVINSFHVVPITIIFIIILKAKLRDSISKTVSVRLAEFRN